MKPEPVFPRPCVSKINLAISIAFLFFCRPLFALDLVDGPLGIWLQAEAVPELTKLLNHHPRLKGEQIKIVSLVDGRPVTPGNVLSGQIRQQLTQDLIDGADVRIPYTDKVACRSVETRNLLGIEVRRSGGQRYRVSLAMLDAEEGIWINGTSQHWTGRLTENQKRNLGKNILKPDWDIYSVDQTSEIGEALLSQLECQLPIDAPIYFVPGNDAREREILRKVRQGLLNRTLTSLDREAAGSIINLTLPPDQASGIAALDLLTGQGSRGIRLAEVTLSNSRRGVFAERRPATGRITRQPEPADLISDIQIESKRNKCHGEGPECVDIKFRVHQSAYIMPFFTRNGYAVPLNCKLESRQRPGVVEYGLKVPRGTESDRPSLGFYVLAVENRSDALALQSQLAAGAKRCEKHPRGSAKWIVSMRNTLENMSQPVSWESLHFIRTSNDINVM